MSTLAVQGDTLGAAGSRLSDAGNALPQRVDLDLTDCGSPQVAAAARDVALYVSTELMKAADSIVQSGQAATQAAQAFEEADAKIAKESTRR